jgi:maleylpyruvate isomerase
MVLYGFWRSTASWRVRIALGLKGVQYEYRPVDLRTRGGAQHSEAYRAKNPMRQVPLLEAPEDAGRTVRIAQSLAIIEYLEERYPDPPLLPRGRVERAHVRQVAEAINSGIQPLGNTSVQLYVRDVLGADEAKWNRHWVTLGLGAVEEMIRPTAGRFAFGDAPTMADVCIVPQLHFAGRFGVDVAAYPTIDRVARECASLEAFARAHADRQVDAPRS